MAMLAEPGLGTWVELFRSLGRSLKLKNARIGKIVIVLAYVALVITIIQIVNICFWAGARYDTKMSVKKCPYQSHALLISSSVAFLIFALLSGYLGVKWKRLETPLVKQRNQTAANYYKKKEENRRKRNWVTLLFHLCVVISSVQLALIALQSNMSYCDFIVKDSMFWALNPLWPLMAFSILVGLGIGIIEGNADLQKNSQ